MNAANYPDIIMRAANLALAHQADSPFKTTLIINEFGIQFSLCEPDSFDPFKSVRIEPDDDFEKASKELDELTDLLDFKSAEEFELAQMSLHDAQYAYYQKHGTKGEY